MSNIIVFLVPLSPSYSFTLGRTIGHTRDPSNPRHSQTSPTHTNIKPVTTAAVDQTLDHPAAPNTSEPSTVI